MKIYEKLFDFSWITSGELPFLPGLYSELPEPKKGEIEELQEKHVLPAEWENFCGNKGPSQDNLIILSAAARCDLACMESCKTFSTNRPQIAREITPTVCLYNLTDWRKTLTTLIERKFSYGFSKRGPVKILAMCLRWGLKLRFLSRHCKF